MRRWSINFLCASSLLIFLLTIPLWIRSYFQADVVVYAHETTPGTGLAHTINFDSAWSALGAIAFKRRQLDGLDASTPHWSYDHYSNMQTLNEPPTDLQFNLQLGTFQIYRSLQWSPELTVSDHGIVIPLWLFLPTAIPPLLWWRRWRRNHGRGFPVGSAAALPLAPIAGEPRISPPLTPP